jgi:ABC-2 type transport system ATP-binding protein
MEDEVVVEAKQLLVRYGDFTAVDHISFAVRRGEIYGFLGANGAGKTTTIRVLCGLLPPTSGDVRVAGIGYRQDEAPLKAVARPPWGMRISAGGYERVERTIKTKVGYMSQKFTLYNDLTVGENLDFIASLHKMAPAVYRRRRQELLEFISFKKNLGDMVGELSGGIKQQVSLAAAMLHDPEIVFLDEPTAGVTPAGRLRFWKLIRRLAENGKTVFVTTHYMDEAEQCGRIALMRDGRLIAEDSPAGLKKLIFPEPVFEFDPIKPLSFSELKSFETHEAFSFFQPYGHRFHAAAANAEVWARRAPDLRTIFSIRPIAPSLEDVFIRAIEGRR